MKPTPKLSILIATTIERAKTFNALIRSLEAQDTEPGVIEILVDPTPKNELSIGAKRQSLIEKAKGEYLVFLDSDDTVLPNYIELILAAIDNTKPDCVDMNILMLTNGLNPQMCLHHLKNKIWHSQGEKYYRNVTHFNPVRRELALKVGFKDLRFGEDKDFADRLTPLCNTSTEVKEIIYIYNYSNKESHNAKYGI